MRSITAILLLTSLALSAAPTQAQAVANPVSNEDQTVYDTLYREKLATVRRTRTVSDDMTLATEMMAFAKNIPDDSGVQCLIYIDTITLASAGSDIKMMVAAAKGLESYWPDHPSLDQNFLIDQANRAYRGADRAKREEVGEDYLSLLLSLADRAEKKEDIEEAISLCRQANTIARAIGSQRRSKIEKILDRLASESALADRIKMLALSVRKNPQNTPAARELVELLLIKRDDPVAAAEFVTSTQDEDLIDVVQFCAKGIDNASPPAAMRVADWYLTSSENADERYAEPLLRRSVDWYERFIALYTREDALAKRVETLNKVAKVKLDQLVQKRKDEQFGRWIDLVDNYFEPELHVLGDDEKKENVDVRDSAVEAEGASIVLPVSPKKSYEMRVSFTTHEKNEDSDSAFIMHLPVGPEAVTFHYHLTGKLVAWIYRIEDTYEIEDREDGTDRLTKLLFQVSVIDRETVEIAIEVDDKPAIYWRGPAEELRQDEDFLPPERMGSVIRITCPSNTTFHKMEMRVKKSE